MENSLIHALKRLIDQIGSKKEALTTVVSFIQQQKKYARVFLEYPEKMQLNQIQPQVSCIKLGPAILEQALKLNKKIHK